MANLTVSLPAPAADGVGAAQDTSALGGRRTITVQDAFRGTVIIEVSEDGGVTFAPIAAFTNAGQQVIDFAGNSMRVRRGGVPSVNPGLPNVEVAAADAAGVYLALPVSAGDGTGASTASATLPGFKTITVGGTFTGTVLIEISEDNVDWSAVAGFTPGTVLQSLSFTAIFMRVRRLGVKENPGTPIVNVGAVPDVGGGGGGSSYTLQTIEVSPPATANLPDGTATLDANDEVNVKNITASTGLVTVNPTAGETIDGAASYVFSAPPFASRRFNWDGISNWRVV